MTKRFNMIILIHHSQNTIFFEYLLLSFCFCGCIASFIVYFKTQWRYQKPLNAVLIPFFHASMYIVLSGRSIHTTPQLRSVVLLHCTVMHRNCDVTALWYYIKFTFFFTWNAVKLRWLAAESNQYYWHHNTFAV